MSRLDEPLPYYPWKWRDFRSNRKVIQMDYIERGLYRELLDECWSEGSIPDDIEQLAEICNCPVEVMADAWQKLSKCFVLVDGVLINEKLHSLRTASDKGRVAKANAGKLGGLARSKASNGADSEASAKEMLSTCHIAEQSRAKQSIEEQSKETHMPSPARAVFEHWQRVMNSPRSAFDGKRDRVIRARLKDGYTPEELCNAITGCSMSPFHMGDNDKSTKYNGLDLIMRNSEKVDQFIGFYHNPPRVGGSSSVSAKFDPHEFIHGNNQASGGEGGRIIDGETE